MAVDERHRLQLADAAKRALGDDAGITLMELLPPVGWADVATKHDIARLDGRFEEIDRRFDEIDRRFEEIDRRFEEIDRRFDRMEGRFDELESRLELRFDAKFERGFRQILVTMTSLMVAGMATTVAVAFAR
jgi:hypothetical protein